MNRQYFASSTKRRTPRSLYKSGLLLVLGLFLLTVSLGVFGAIRPETTRAVSSTTLTFQARLLNTNGSLVADGTYNVEFKIYDTVGSGASAQGVCSLDSSTDDCWWLETRTGANKVTVKNGYVYANLGSVTAFSSTIPWDQELWITMNIGGTGAPSWDGEMSPRFKVAAVPYAFAAAKLQVTDSAITNKLVFATPTASNKTITLPNETGTVCTTGSICSGYVASTAGFIQNGNSFGVTATLGTNDINNLALETNDTIRLTIDTSNAVYFGNGITNTTPSGFTLNATGGSGTNIAGAALTIAGGKGTGTGVGGSIVFQYAPAGASGASLNTLQTACSISGTNGSLSCPGSYAGSERFGANSVSTATNSLSVGSGATANDRASAIGNSATASAAGSISLGYQASAGAIRSIAIGFQTTSTYAGSIIIGSDTSATTTQQLIIGSTTTGYGINDAYIGNGITNASPLGVKINATGGSGTNIAGAALTVAGGRGTGSATGGSILFQTATAGASGASLNALTTRLTIDQVGLATFANDLAVAGATTLNGSITLGDAVTDNLTITSAIQGANALIFDGATDNTNEITLAITDPGADFTITLPAETGTICTTGSVCSGYQAAVTGGAANQQLSNLSGTVAINQSLLPGADDTIDLGDNTHRFRDLYLGGETIHLGTSTSDEATFGYTTSINILDITSTGGLSFTAGSSADYVFNTDSDTNLQVTATAAPGVDIVTVSNSSQGTTTDGVSALKVTFVQADDADATDTNAAINLVVTSSSGDADGLQGLNIANITGGSSAERALQIGSGWDANLFLNDTTTQIQVANTGVITFEDDAGNDLFTITDTGTTGDINFTGKLKEDGVEVLSSIIAAYTTTCPTGWTEYTAARGRYIVGTPSGGTDTATVGTALSNSENRPTGAHNHPDSSHSHGGLTGGDGVGIPAYNNYDLPNSGAGAAGWGYSVSGAVGGHWFNYFPTQSANTSTPTSTGTSGVSGTNAPYIQLKYCQKTAGSDLAEWTDTNEKLTPGTIVSIDKNDSQKIVSSKVAYDETVSGVVSTEPGWILGPELQEKSDKQVQLALTGRVPVKVTIVNGSIKAGDPITTSDIPGVGMKATKPGTIIGRAMEDFIPDADGNGKVTVLLNTTWQDPSKWSTLEMPNISTIIGWFVVVAALVYTTRIVRRTRTPAAHA